MPFPDPDPVPFSIPFPVRVPVPSMLESCESSPFVMVSASLLESVAAIVSVVVSAA